MRQAIVTKYLPWTDHREARIKAKAACASVTVSFDSGKSVEENHWQAAQALIVKQGWDDKDGWQSHWVPGGKPDGTGNCYVYNDGDTLHLGQTVARARAIELHQPAFSIWANGRQQDYFAASFTSAESLINAIYVSDGYANFTKDDETDPDALPSWSCEIAGVTFSIQQLY